MEGGWSENIVEASPMRADNTSFQIPNGTIAKYMKGFQQLGYDDLKIRFYDNGYSDMQEGIENRKISSYTFLAGGVLMTVLVLLLFGYLFIGRQEQRTAIERCLGMTRRDARSL